MSPCCVRIVAAETGWSVKKPHAAANRKGIPDKRIQTVYPTPAGHPSLFGSRSAAADSARGRIRQRAASAYCFFPPPLCRYTLWHPWQVAPIPPAAVCSAATSLDCAAFCTAAPASPSALQAFTQPS